MPPESQTLESLAQEIAILGDLRVNRDPHHFETHEKLLGTATTSSKSPISSGSSTFENFQYYRNGRNTIVEHTSATTAGSNRILQYETQVLEENPGASASAWQFSTEVKNLEVRWETTLQSDIAPVVESMAETQVVECGSSSDDETWKDVAFENAVSEDLDVYIALMGPDELDKLQFIRNCLEEEQAFVPILGAGRDGSDISVYRFTRNDRNIHLVHLPSFTNPISTPGTLLKKLVCWLDRCQREEIRVNGIIYIDPRPDHIEDKSPLDRLMLKSVVGLENFFSVALVRHDSILHPSQNDYVVELNTQWNELVLEGCAEFELDINVNNGLRVVDHLIDQHSKIVLRIQIEMVSTSRSLNETAAGREIDSYLTARMSKIPKGIEQVNCDLLEQGETQESTSKQMEMLNLLADLEDQRDALHVTLRDITREGEEEVKREMHAYYESALPLVSSFESVNTPFGLQIQETSETNPSGAPFNALEQLESIQLPMLKTQPQESQEVASFDKKDDQDERFQALRKELETAREELRKSKAQERALALRAEKLELAQAQKASSSQSPFEPLEVQSKEAIIARNNQLLLTPMAISERGRKALSAYSKNLDKDKQRLQDFGVLRNSRPGSITDKLEMERPISKFSPVPEDSNSKGDEKLSVDKITDDPNQLTEDYPFLWAKRRTALPKTGQTLLTSDVKITATDTEYRRQTLARLRAANKILGVGSVPINKGILGKPDPEAQAQSSEKEKDKVATIVLKTGEGKLSDIAKNNDVDDLPIIRPNFARLNHGYDKARKEKLGRDKSVKNDDEESESTPTRKSSVVLLASSPTKPVDKLSPSSSIPARLSELSNKPSVGSLLSTSVEKPVAKAAKLYYPIDKSRLSTKPRLFPDSYKTTKPLIPNENEKEKQKPKISPSSVAPASSTLSSAGATPKKTTPPTAVVSSKPTLASRLCPDQYSHPSPPQASQAPVNPIQHSYDNDNHNNTLPYTSSYNAPPPPRQLQPSPSYYPPLPQQQQALPPPQPMMVPDQIFYNATYGVWYNATNGMYATWNPNTATFIHAYTPPPGVPEAVMYPTQYGYSVPTTTGYYGGGMPQQGAYGYPYNGRSSSSCVVM